MFLAAIAIAVLSALTGARTARAQATVDDFNPAPDAQVFSMAVQPDGDIVVGGDFGEIGGQTRGRVARLSPDGTPDGLSLAADAPVSSITVQPDGGLLVGGNFTELAGTPRNYIARITPAGTVDDTFNPSANERVYSILQQPDGAILVGGVFDEIGGETRSRLARLTVAGAVEPGFAPDFNDYVTAIALHTDDAILVGGAFTKVGTKNRGGLARLAPNGTLDDTFVPSANDDVFAIAVQADGKILVGGRFSKIGNADTGSLVRLNPNGSLDGSFGAEVTGGAVVSIALDAAGRVVIGGDFAEVNGTAMPRLARLLPNGQLDSTFNLPVNSGDIDGFVSALTIQPDGKILVAGTFSQIGTTARDFLARVGNTGSRFQSLSVSPLGSTITWLRAGSVPELTAAEFAYTTGGAPFQALGRAVRTSGGWELSGLTLPANEPVTIRARGVHYTNVYGAGSLIEVSTNVEIEAATLELRTVTLPDAPPSAWTVDASGVVSFTTTLTGTATTGPRAVAAGPYTITITPDDTVNVVPYATSHTCTVNGAPGPSGNIGTLELTLASGDNAVCAFINSAALTTVGFSKFVDAGPFGDATPEAWTFAVGGQTVGHGGTLELLQGVYIVDEAGPVGYAPRDAGGACALVGNDIVLTVPVPGTDIAPTCSITNTVQDTGVSINLLEPFGVSSLTEGANEGAGSQTCHWITASDAPTGTVTVSLSPSDQVLFDRAGVMLTADNWNNTAASDPSNLVCMRAVDNAIDERDGTQCKERTTDPLGGPGSGVESCGDHVAFVAHRVSASDDARFFNGIPFASNGLADLDGDPRTVDVLLTDNDLAAITVSPPAKATLRERQSTTYTISLQTEPRAPVQIAMVANAVLTAAPAEVTFDAGNWTDPVTITVTAVQDFVDTGDQIARGVISHTVTSTDTNYAVLKPAGVAIDVTNIDRAGFVFSRESLTVPSTGSVRYGVILTSKPATPVVIVLTPSTGVRIDAACPVDGIRDCLVVTSETWNTLRLVTVTSDGSPGTIGHTLNSGDPKFDGQSATLPVNQGGSYAIHLPMIQRD